MVAYKTFLYTTLCPLNFYSTWSKGASSTTSKDAFFFITSSTNFPFTSSRALKKDEKHSIN